MTLEDERKRWEEKIVGPLDTPFPERKAEFQTPSGIPLPPILTPPDPDPDYMDQLGFPGEYPFTRGVQPTMYRGRFWTMRQYAGYASARRIQPALPLSAGTGTDRPIRWRSTCPRRSATTPMTRWRRVRWARWASRSLPWKIWRTLFHRNPTGQSLHQHDHQRPGCHPAGHVHRRGQEAGGGDKAAARHDPE